MKLDFSTLTQPAEKARGQVGTTGTPVFMRVCASPGDGDTPGTSGDKPAAVAAAGDLPAAVPAPCPQVSPACPPALGTEKPNAGAVSPVSPVVPSETAQVAAAALFERDCADCLHRLRPGTCGEPVAAGLFTAAHGFGIVWPPEGHGAACPAYAGKMPTASANRPHRLTNDEADRCHAPCWNDGEIVAFTARAERFVLLGRADADDLAEQLTLRDRDGDDRRLCLECTWLGDTGRCLAAATGRIPGADRRLEPVQTLLQRCGAFGLRKGLA